MKLLSKYIIVILIIVSSVAQAQNKGMRVGYVDMDYILDNLNEYKVANEQFSIQVKAWKEKVQEKQTEIDNRKKELDAEKPLLTPELIRDKEEEIAILENNLKAYQQEKFGADQGDYIKQRITLVRPIQDQVFNIVQEIGKSKNYDYIVEKSDISMLYANERHNLSDIILRVLNKKNNRDDREKNVGELLQENYDYQSVNERKKQEIEREQQRKDIIVTKQAEREARRQRILEERKQRLEQRRLEREARMREREELRNKKLQERKK